HSEARAVKGGENDRAYLFGTDGDDVLVSSPKKNTLVSEGYTSSAKTFERYYVHAQDGNDRAMLFDSKLDDRFVAKHDNARLFNDDYFIKVNDFDKVDAYSSSGGADRAYFYDSVGDDTLISLENETRLFGSGFDNTSHGFARQYTHAINGGNDTAYVYDTDGADTYKLQDNISKMYGTGYYSWMRDFETTETRFASANRHARAIVFGTIDDSTMDEVGNLSSIINEYGSYYIYDVAAQEASGATDNDDEAFLSIAEDIFELIPDYNGA
ncbi:MAG: hypothetical protein AAGA30_19800, partial [Planctomycetota bacterium]